MNIKKELQELKNRWDNRAKNWDNDLEDPSHYSNFENSYERTDLFTSRHIAQYLKTRGVKTLGKGIDLGCGTGESTLKLIDVCDYIYGIDISPKMITIARHKNLPVKFNVGNVLSLPFESNTFDILISRGIMISHIPFGSQQKALTEIGRVAKPESLIIFDFLHDIVTKRKFTTYSGQKAIFDKEKITKLLFAVGIRGKYYYGGRKYERVNRIAIFRE